MSRIVAYQLEDALGNLRALAFLNLLLAFCIAAPDPGRAFTDYHVAVLLIQAVLLLGYLSVASLRTRAITLCVFAVVVFTTVHEVVAWVGGLDGVIHGTSSGKGAPFTFVLQSPPYIYPFIRLGSLFLFLPIFRTFPTGAWERKHDPAKR